MATTFSDVVDEFCAQLRRRQIEGSLPTAARTAVIMRHLVTSQRHPDAQALIQDIKRVGAQLQQAKPTELVIGNIVRRVLHVVREEMQAESEEGMTEAVVATLPTPSDEKSSGLLSRALRQAVVSRAVSLHNLLDQGMFDGLDAAVQSPVEARQQPAAEGSEGEVGKKKRGASWRRKPQVIEQMNELIDELEEIDANIALQAVDHIHANEVILTFGYSRTVLVFLRDARKKRDFQVVVAEGAPTYQGHAMARDLADAGVHTTAVMDAAMFAMMARMNKVVVGVHALLANGGVVAPVGMHLVAMAARQHSVPFVVLVGMYKLSPLFPHDPTLTFNDFKSPAAVLDYGDIADMSVSGEESGAHLHVHNPSYDYIPPELISLFVTDTGYSHTPSYVYRLLAEYYDREDCITAKEY